MKWINLIIAALVGFAVAYLIGWALLHTRDAWKDVENEADPVH
jgi:biotin transporter BioY